VIEMPGGFTLCVVKEKTPKTLTAAALSTPNINYEQWLAEKETPQKSKHILKTLDSRIQTPEKARTVELTLNFRP